MATFNIPNIFSTGQVIESAPQNANWVAIKAFVEGISTGANLDASSISTAKIQDGAVTGTKIATGTITDTNILNGTITLQKLAASLQAYLVPAGTISATIRSTADTGWILLDGTPVANAQSLYPALWAVVPASWQSGSTLLIPNMADKMLEGVGATLRGITGGSNSITLAEANLPAHFHTVNPPSTSLALSDPGHFHGPDGQKFFVSQVNNPPVQSQYASATALYNVDYYGSNITKTDTKTTGITGSVDIAEFNSGSVGSATTINSTNAHLAVNFQIKAH
jgi:microcystin-dependent protein